MFWTSLRACAEVAFPAHRSRPIAKRLLSRLSDTLPLLSGRVSTTTEESQKGYERTREGKRQRVSKNAVDTVAIAMARDPVDANVERPCLIGRAELVKDYKHEYNQDLAGMNIDLDWAMFELT